VSGRTTAAATLGLRGITIVSQLGYFVVLARGADTVTVGTYAIALAVWTLGRALLPMGWNIHLLRVSALGKERGSLGEAARQLRVAVTDTAIVGIGLVALAAVINAVWLRQSFEALLMTGVVAILWAFIGILSGFVRGAGKLLLSQLADGPLVYGAPFAMIAIVSASGAPLNLRVALWSFAVGAVSALTALGIGCHYVVRSHNARERLGRDRETSGRRAALALLPSQLMSAISSRLPVLVAGPTAGVAAVAVVEAGLRVQLVGATLTWAAGTVSSPRYAVLSQQSERLRIERLLSASVWAALIPTGLLAAVILLAGRYLLSFLGPEYVAGFWVVAVMAVASVVEVPGATAGYYLVMAGENRTAFRATSLQAATITVSGVVFGMLFGAEGIAIAVLLGSLVRSLVASLVLWHRDRLNVMALNGLADLYEALSRRPK
jgi:O-antigen/teichoic acid export membrane protein